jgi:transposase InsO family protein
MGGTVRAILGVVLDLLRLGTPFFRSSESIRAENLVLRKQLARFLERGIKPRRVDHARRVSLAILTRLIHWRSAVVDVKPSTITRWHRLGWRIVWRMKCRAGCPKIALELRQLIRRMAAENPIWGQERIANELLVKLGIRVSPRTVAKYMPKRAPGVPRGDQRWATFLKNHAKALDESIRALGVESLVTPIASRRANSICERVIGTVRRDYLDWVIPTFEKHLRAILHERSTHYDPARVHMELGYGVPDPPKDFVVIARSDTRHRLATGVFVRARSVWNGSHHEYSIANTPAAA